MHAVLYLIRAEVEISGEIHYSQYRYICTITSSLLQSCMSRSVAYLIIIVATTGCLVVHV